MKHRNGFTLVELLVVISLVGILAAVTMSIINPKKQRDDALDAVRQSNLQKFALSIEAYGNSVGTYPTSVTPTGDNDNRPLDEGVRVFVSKIPNGEPLSTDEYVYDSNDEGETFGIVVFKSGNNNDCFKYRSTWGEIRECISATNCVPASDDCGDGGMCSCEWMPMGCDSTNFRLYRYECVPDSSGTQQCEDFKEDIFPDPTCN